MSEGLALFDAEVRRHFCDCVAIDPSDSEWLQVQLSLSRGGLGLCRLALHCSAAYLASVNKAGCSAPPDECIIAFLNPSGWKATDGMLSKRTRHAVTLRKAYKYKIRISLLYTHMHMALCMYTCSCMLTTLSIHSCKFHRTLHCRGSCYGMTQVRFNSTLLNFISNICTSTNIRGMLRTDLRSRAHIS